MADPRRYSISILENYSDIPLQKIALAVTKKIEKEISSDDFTLEDVEDLELGSNFLTTEDPYTWWNVIEDLAPAFTDFPDVCFCLSVSDGEDGGQYRVLFFNGKYVKQYPEIRYEEFRPNDFEYEASKKEPLPIIQGKLLPTVTRPPLFLEEATEPDPVALDFIKKSLFGDIILENRQDD
jgi:hypothetical protein